MSRFDYGRKRLFTTAHHPSRIIDDDDLLRRYQARRLLIAVVGGLLGGIGVGLTFSHSGFVGASFEEAILLPLLVGVAIAAVFVWFPLPEILRWLAMVTLIGLSIALMEMSLSWKIGLAVVGFVLSWVVAVVVQFGIGVVQLTLRDFVLALKMLTGFVFVNIAVVVAGSLPAAGQEPNTALCPVGRIVVSVNGEGQVFSAVGGQPLVIAISGDRDRTVIPISASAEVERGTIIVELVDLDPIPSLPSRPVVVWSGDLSPSEDSSGGVTEQGEVVVERGPSGELRVVTAAHQVPIGLIAGQGRYRATLLDAATGDECILEGLVRVVAPPLSTRQGRMAVVGAVVGLGLAAGSLRSGSLRPDLASSTAASGTDIPSSSSTPEAPKVSVGSQRLVSRATAATGALYTIVLQVRIAENDENVYHVSRSNIRLLNMVDIQLVGGLSGPGDWAVPILVTTDPKKAVFEFASVDLELVSGDSSLPIGSLVLPAENTPWRLTPPQGPEIDLRIGNEDVHPPFVTAEPGLAKTVRLKGKT